MKIQKKKKPEIELYSEAWTRQKVKIIIEMTKKGHLFPHLEDQWKEDADVAMAAITNCGLMLQHMSPAMQKNKDIVTLAVKNNPRALQYVSNDLKSHFYIEEEEEEEEITHQQSYTKVSPIEKHEA